MNAASPSPIQTPLQDALLAAAQAGDGDALHQRHQDRLQALAEACRRHQDSGLPPAEYAQAQRLLAMCEAGLRVLALQPRAAAASAGPAAGLPR